MSCIARRHTHTRTHADTPEESAVGGKRGRRPFSAKMSFANQFVCGKVVLTRKDLQVTSIQGSLCRHCLIRIIHEWTVSWQKYAFKAIGLARLPVCHPARQCRGPATVPRHTAIENMVLAVGDNAVTYYRQSLCNANRPARHPATMTGHRQPEFAIGKVLVRLKVTRLMCASAETATLPLCHPLGNEDRDPRGLGQPSNSKSPA